MNDSYPALVGVARGKVVAGFRLAVVWMDQHRRDKRGLESGVESRVVAVVAAVVVMVIGTSALTCHLQHWELPVQLDPICWQSCSTASRSTQSRSK